ncbi:MAG: protein TolR [Gammaproteobacteria bacterium HGW-Gammaproteobacteria-5]|jgi:biopolymer transport protein TolR|nr:MAG: protein TolR [Gammaproteobacteria bacterium HGW-Gammaproteobacteria-5]PKM16160.1 MAG: protein TolR [Gammaproteobacteria bacterium HGW-Gammaproteobacteria-2]
MSSRRKRRKLKAEINVVPYIDVMLVLLIIFMVTAPLLNLGVDIELPQSNAKPVEQMKDPVVIVVDADGNYFLTLEGVPKESISADALVAKVSAFVRNNPQVPVLVAGDQQVGYGAVYQVMVLLQQAGVAKVGLMSKPVEDSARKRP